MDFTLPISRCSICSRLPNSASANLLNQEELPDAAFALDGMEGMSQPGESVERKLVSCPQCGTVYAFSCDAHAMEWDVYLRRLTPLEAHEVLSPGEQQQRIAAEREDVQVVDLEARKYAVRTILQAEAKQKNWPAVQAFLASEDMETRREAHETLLTLKDISAIESFLRSELETEQDPFVRSWIEYRLDPAREFPANQI